MPRPPMESGVFESYDQRTTQIEKNVDDFTHGAAYIYLKPLIQRMMGEFAVQAYIPRKGVVTVTNKGTAQHGLAIILDKVSKREPDESDVIYFDAESVESLTALGFNKRALHARTMETAIREEMPSDQPMDPEVKRRILGVEAETKEAMATTGVYPKADVSAATLTKEAEDKGPATLRSAGINEKRAG